MLVSRSMDEALPELDARALARHLERCTTCRSYLETVDAFTRELRGAPLVGVRLEVIPTARRARFARVARGSLAAAAVVWVAGFGFLGARALEPQSQAQRPSKVLVIDATGADTAQETKRFLRGLRDATLAREVGGPLPRQPSHPGASVG